MIYDDYEKMENYAHDEVAGEKYAHMPEVVVKPAAKEEIAAIVRLANKKLIPITPRGAGSGLSGGAVPVYGGILLSVERMNKVLEIDRENMVIVVEPGVITNEINKMLKEYGLFYAGYPMSLESCFIGGNVAENAGGGKAIKYGVTGRYVLGLEVVLPTGEIAEFGGKRVKDVTGYDMVGLMVGSEGTLGIFTKIILRLLPLPTAKVDLLVLFNDVETAISIVPEIISKGRIVPTAIEFMDRLSAQTACEYLNEQIPYEKAGAMLLIELDGNNREQLEAEYEVIGELCLDKGAIEVYVADNYTTQERIWGVRRAIAEAFKVVSPVQSLEDIVVPISKIPNLMPHLERLSKKYNVQIPCYGHAGDGNLHATVVKSPDTSMEHWEAVIDRVLAELYEAAKGFGGTISGEHGIGHKRSKFMPSIVGDVELTAMRRIKNALDPLNLMNPGKIFS
ncbi:MAG: FAD-binding oxidoreductase [Dethiobacteria bacterium]